MMVVQSSHVQNPTPLKRRIQIYDGTMAHTARATIDLLKEAFPGRLISRFGRPDHPI